MGGGLGLLSMRERAYFLDGDVYIRSKPGMGTQISVRVPVESSEATVNHTAARIA